MLPDALTKLIIKASVLNKIMGRTTITQSFMMNRDRKQSDNKIKAQIFLKVFKLEGIEFGSNRL